MIMNGIEKITNRILAEAEVDAGKIREEAAARCKEIRAEYDQKAQDAYWNLVRSGVKETEQRMQRIGSTAEMEAKKSMLSLKQDMVELAFTEAKKRLLGLSKEDYTAFLTKLAVRASEHGREAVILNAGDRARCGDAVVAAANKQIKKGQLTLSEETRDIEGGLILKNGDVEVNCAVETLMNFYRDDLATQAAEIMFGA